MEQAGQISAANQAYINKISNAKKEISTPQQQQEIKDGDKKSINALKWVGIIAAATLAVGGAVYAYRHGRKVDVSKLTETGNDVLKNGQKYTGKAVDQVKDGAGNVVKTVTTSYNKGIIVKETVQQGDDKIVKKFKNGVIDKITKNKQQVDLISKEGWDLLNEKQQKVKIDADWADAIKENEVFDTNKINEIAKKLKPDFDSLKDDDKKAVLEKAKQQYESENERRGFSMLSQEEQKKIVDSLHDEANIENLQKDFNKLSKEDQTKTMLKDWDEAIAENQERILKVQEEKQEKANIENLRENFNKLSKEEQEKTMLKDLDEANIENLQKDFNKLSKEDQTKTMLKDWDEAIAFDKQINLGKLRKEMVTDEGNFEQRLNYLRKANDGAFHENEKIQKAFSELNEDTLCVCSDEFLSDNLQNIIMTEGYKDRLQTMQKEFTTDEIRKLTDSKNNYCPTGLTYFICSPMNSEKESQEYIEWLHSLCK